MRTITEAAKKKVNIEGWEPYLFETCHGGECIVTGCQTTIKTRGKNKGKLKYDTKKNNLKIIISKEELEK